MKLSRQMVKRTFNGSSPRWSLFLISRWSLASYQTLHPIVARLHLHTMVRALATVPVMEQESGIQSKDPQWEKILPAKELGLDIQSMGLRLEKIRILCSPSRSRARRHTCHSHTVRFHVPNR